MYFLVPRKKLIDLMFGKNAIGGHIVSLEPQTVFKCRRICHKHFEPHYYTRSNRLSANAVPTLHLSGNIASIERQPLQNITQRVTLVSNLGVSSPSQPLVQETPPQASTSYILPSKAVKSKKKPVIVPDIAVLGNKIRRLQKAKDTAVIKLKKIMNLSENPAFQRALSKFTSTALIFTMLQFREAGIQFRRRGVGRRFNKKEKLMSLALYKQGPRAYRWMRKFCVLPSPLTLTCMIKKAALKPGIYENIFYQLKKVARRMNKKEKLCILLFDEISLTPHFDYNKRNAASHVLWIVGVAKRKK